MVKTYLPLAAMTALLTAAATVAQPQTTTSEATTATPAETTPSTSTPETNPGSTTTGTATDPSTGTQGMHGGFRGTPADDTAIGTGTTTGTSSTATTTEGAGTSSSAAGVASGTTGADATAGQAGTSTTATAGVAGSSQLQGQDATFLRKAIEADRMEIASAQAALDNAERSDTRNAARMILEDHQQSSQKLQALASRKGWTLPSASDTPESDQALMSTSGSGSFDDRFMADQIRMHREAISLYRAQASSGSDPDLRQFARDQLPHLEHHLEMLQGSNTQK